MSSFTKTPQLEQPRILIIDDSRLVRVSLGKVLGAEFDIVEAENGEDGWEVLLADDKIQVVLTDAGMPLLNGYELIERIRTHHEPRIRDIPVNMVTGAEDEESRQRALGLGATDFITKPFDKAQLLARIRAQARFDQTSRDLAETAEALVEHATDDALTGLKSRRYFLKRGEQDLAFANRHKQELAVIAVGIDGYDAIANQQSAEVANKILAAVANCLQSCIRTEDTLARTGDSCFAIIAPALGRPETTVVCERIRQRIAESGFGADMPELSLTASLGLVNHRFDTKDKIEDLLARAEKFSAKAQAAGGNRLVATKLKQAPKKRVSIDAALHILAHGDKEKLTPHLAVIAAQIVPLLELCNDKQQWGIDEQLQAIKDKVNAA